MSLDISQPMLKFLLHFNTNFFYLFNIEEKLAPLRSLFFHAVSLSFAARFDNLEQQTKRCKHTLLKYSCSNLTKTKAFPSGQPRTDICSWFKELRLSEESYSTFILHNADSNAPLQSHPVFQLKSNLLLADSHVLEESDSSSFVQACIGGIPLEACLFLSLRCLHILETHSAHELPRKWPADMKGHMYACIPFH